MSIGFTSTNGISKVETFEEALMKGQAPDGGLFVPDRIPKVTDEELLSFKDKQYFEIATTIIGKFMGGEISEKDLLDLTKDTYSFKPVIEKVYEKNYLMRLDRGPTASFKDFAAQFMGRLMNYFLIKRGGKLTILTATSGDTGSAVANAFHGRSNIKVIVLYPKNEVSDNQRKQMTTLGENITAISVDGKFDDCQALVKKAFNDPTLNDCNLTSANSINIGRLIPQSVYYFFAHSRITENVNEKVVISVPSGNFGNLMGGLIAMKMGLPVERFISAVNENDEFPKFLETGSYEPIRPSKACLSNAMNVGHPSNLARIIWFYGGKMLPDGTIEKMPDMEELNGDIFSCSVTDNETKMSIKSAYENHKIILEPHGAVAWEGMMRYISNSGSVIHSVSLETADPAKFPDEVVNILGITPKVPKTLRAVLDKKEEIIEMEIDYPKFNEIIRSILSK